MSSLDKLKKITEEIKKFKEKIKKLENIRNNILLEVFKEKNSEVISYNLFKNSDEILITKNDIECENSLSECDINSEESTDED